MMNSDTTPTVNQAPVSAANTTGDQVSRFGAECPIRVGDEVTGRDNPTWRGRVRSIYLNDEVAECAIETADGRRGFAPPWALVPADTEPSREWRDRMQTFKKAQRDQAMEALRRKRHEAAEHAEDLAGRLNTIATALRDGDTPDPGEPVENLAHTFAFALHEVTELDDRVVAAGLSATDEPQRHSAAEPAGSDELLAWFRVLQQRIRDEIDCYSTREDGTEDSSACADHHDRLEALYAEANDTMAALDSHLDTGGPLPAAWAHMPTPHPH
ncbi:hypothetical protein IU436_30275 [Nocardia farcinica]|uniref:Uncharacterized protein n=6 Tax=Nocardiaceae TaxID=85025 RepID=A0A7G1KIZ7_9NOCA|nr:MULTISPECIES: hypothetical protein [Nocardia]MCP2287115.1 hypothetical protein [Nocardia amikacinitolerans]MBF6259816.1 hypothetical protein [Nocardia farcinica]MBF6271373.1 hypothetical protein [Nocardia farcinica]MBF6295410.1 hypothetical protein [Nocardia farcinica]MBF6362305.1 hypothetical protein [Nocardia farcinica]